MSVYYCRGSLLLYFQVQARSLTTRIALQSLSQMNPNHIITVLSLAAFLHVLFKKRKV